MRSRHWAEIDGRRPVLVPAYEVMVGRTSTVTVAPVTKTADSVTTDVLAGPGSRTHR